MHTEAGARSAPQLGSSPHLGSSRPRNEVSPRKALTKPETGNREPGSRTLLFSFLDSCVPDSIDSENGNCSRYGCHHSENCGMRIAEWSEWIERSGRCRTARVAKREGGAE